MSKKKITDEVRAKHVFGELTLGDIIPLVQDKCTLVTIIEDMDEDFVNFSMDEECGLELWYDFDDGEPEYSFPYETKVKVKDDLVVLESGEEIIFSRTVPIKIKILDSRKERA